MARSDELMLKIEQMHYGTHQTSWDLKILLYKGASKLNRARLEGLINSGQLGTIQRDRLPLVRKIHEVITGKLQRGVSEDSMVTSLVAIRRFFAWADKANEPLTLHDSAQTFRAWTEALLHRVRIEKSICHLTAYGYAAAVADIVGLALGLPQSRPAITLLHLTRMHPPNKKKRVLGTKADKENLSHTFTFGHFLADLCIALSADVVRGPLPVQLPLRDRQTLTMAGGLTVPTLNPRTIRSRDKREQAIAARAPLEPGRHILDYPQRSRLLNTRIEAELLIFIAQTGVNLKQATGLQRGLYRWQTDGEDLKVFRVYKGRRGGDAVFRCYKAYRQHWERYIRWLTDLGFSDTNGALFPFVYPGKIPSVQARQQFTALRAAADSVEIKFYGPRALRKTRINWLLRRSRDPSQTAAQSAHSKETLLKSYEEPHHQVAALEILRFHEATDPAFAPPGPGICVDDGRTPITLANAPPEAPKPDCISPEGCLFCVHHRDVLSADYCWKLASHSKLKALEVKLYKPSKNNLIHPGNRVVDRISEKLRAIAEGSDVRALWVRDAQDLVRAGRYHPVWSGHIQIMEVLS